MPIEKLARVGSCLKWFTISCRSESSNFKPGRIDKSSYLAMHGNVSNILVNLGSADQEVEDDCDVLESEEVIEHDDLPDITDNLPRSVAPSNVFSPLAFKPCPKGPGRPKKR